MLTRTLMPLSLFARVGECVCNKEATELGWWGSFVHRYVYLLEIQQVIAILILYFLSLCAGGVGALMSFVCLTPTWQVSRPVREYLLWLSSANNPISFYLYHFYNMTDCLILDLQNIVTEIFKNCTRINRTNLKEKVSVILVEIF